MNTYKEAHWALWHLFLGPNIETLQKNCWENLCFWLLMIQIFFLSVLVLKNIYFLILISLLHLKSHHKYTEQYQSQNHIILSSVIYVLWNKTITTQTFLKCVYSLLTVCFVNTHWKITLMSFKMFWIWGMKIPLCLHL